MVEVKDILDYQQFPEYDIIWTDPPWGQRMVNWFQSKLFKDTGIKKDNKIEDIIDQLARLSNNTKPIYIEYSVKGHELILEKMAKYGHKLLSVYNAYQSNKKPYVIIAYNTNIPVDTSGGGFKDIINTMKSYPNNQRVFDPFAGISKTAKTFQSIGHTYIGSELNPKRANTK